MQVSHCTFTVTADQAKAGALVEFVIPAPHGLPVRVLGYRVVAPVLAGATGGAQTLGIGWQLSGSFIEAYRVRAMNPATKPLAITGGQQDSSSTDFSFQGDLQNCVGDADTPLKVYYIDNTNVDQTSDVSIEVVVAYGTY